jgi:hypothetical protein
MRSLISVFVVIGLVMLSSVGDAQIDESLVLYFPFDEGAGDEAEDLSKYGNNGAAVPNADWVDGKFGGAIQVTSGSGHVEIPVSDSLHADFFKGSFTLTAFIKPALSGDAWQHIWRSRPVETGHNTLFVNIGGFLSWRARVGGGWTVLCEGAAGDIVGDEWQHVAIVSDEKNFRMYVNGEVVKETNFMETDGAIETFYVGGDGMSENYTGAIDEVSVWNRDLSEDEIKTLYTEGVEAFLSVDPADKLATTWSKIKIH